MCFAELQGYEIHAGESFVVSGTSSGFLRSSSPDPVTGACVLPGPDDPKHLLRGRLPLDAPACDPSLTANWLGPAPANAPVACTLEANDTGRALRYQNPLIGFVVRVPTRDITAQTGMVTGLPDGGVLAPGSGLTRVPVENTVLSFPIIGGFRPMLFALSSDVLAQLPRAAVIAPDGVTMFVADQGLQSSTAGLRGQIIRFFTDSQSSDSTFQVR